METNAYVKRQPQQKVMKKDRKKPITPVRPYQEKRAKRKEQEWHRKMTQSPRRKTEVPESHRPLFRNFLAPEGCQYGRKCRRYHPNKAGKRRICGQKSPTKKGDNRKERPKSKPNTGNGPRTTAAEAGSSSQGSFCPGQERSVTNMHLLPALPLWI